MKRVTLLTDFGTVDGYVAAMKGVAAGIAPGVILDDASHEIPPGNLQAAAWAVAAYWDRYPVGAVHMVVVDPGVGGRRRPLALCCDGRFLVGPDNGVFTRVIRAAKEWRAVAIENADIMGDVISFTFHGRDIFMPAAAHLANGTPLESLGPAVADPVMLDLPEAVDDGAMITGAIVHADRFGNLVTSVPGGMVNGREVVVQIRGRRLPLHCTYADVGRGHLVALVGSHGCVEIAVRDGSAAAMLGAGRGDTVTVTAAG
ncbi:MAG TPA: SAM-dependent chlorinase/fluorinase [Longimicrobiales bacterium]|nr:SAM-dependent chlorinase/fluorinase [Longimicrobiales bacterium]